MIYLNYPSHNQDTLKAGNYEDTAVSEKLKIIFRDPLYKEMSRKLNHTMTFVCWKYYNEEERLRGQYQKISCTIVQGSPYSPLLYSIEVTNKLGQSGNHVILSVTYKGSTRDNIQRYCDAMTVVRELGKPSYFITMTCSTKCKEIVNNLPFGLKIHQCADLVIRVFNIKLKERHQFRKSNQPFVKMSVKIYLEYVEEIPPEPPPEHENCSGNKHNYKVNFIDPET